MVLRGKDRNEWWGIAHSCPDSYPQQPILNKFIFVDFKVKPLLLDRIQFVRNIILGIAKKCTGVK
jgi:hypothetical protein